MSVLISEIQFNHALNSAASDAISIRKNASQLVPHPEWRRGITERPDQSVAAYAIDQVQGNPITIKVKLERLDANLNIARVRAIQAPTPAIPWWLRSLPSPDLYWPPPRFFSGVAYYYGFLIYNYYYQLRQAWLSTSSNVLGEVKPKEVRFQADGTAHGELFELQNHRLASRGVGIHQVSWLWQYRPLGSPQWFDIGTTRHKIYTILSLPTDPWVQLPLIAQNSQLPWTEVLDFACYWSEGATTLDAAARAVTEAVYNLSPQLIEYGCPIGAFEMYADSLFDSFNCSAFLERLSGGIGNGRYVNCTDCATIVSTFANILGCDLWQSRMGEYTPAFQTNPILAIGSDQFESPCGWGLGFRYHEVAWKDGCTADDAVFDACLLVDIDPFPGNWPQQPGLPANLRFGEPGDGQYRDRLASPSDRHICRPRPEERVRRFVF